MKLSFRQFLSEGGAATKQWNTQRADMADIQEALKQISSTLGITQDELETNLLGSSVLTLNGKRESSGDIDIAVESSNQKTFHKKMMELVQGRGLHNTGTKIGSYALEVKNGKLIQVDLMFVDSPTFAKFMFHSSEGDKSKYPGAVRNIMLMTLTSKLLKPNMDFVVRDDEGNIIAKASKSLKLNVGLERLFKVAKKREDGNGRVKSLDKVDPDVLEKELEEIKPELIGKFSKNPDIVNDPDEIAKYLFGKNAKATDIMTAEQVAEQINKKFSGDKLLKIKEAIKEQLKKSNFPVPSEL